MTQAKYKLTDEHRAQLKPWADKWIANALSTKPMDDEDREAMRVAVRGMYKAASLTPPPDNRIIFVPSPFVLRFAAGFAAGLWWLQKNPKDADRVAEDNDIKPPTKNAVLSATAIATRIAVAAAMQEAVKSSSSRKASGKRPEKEVSSDVADIVKTVDAHYGDNIDTSAWYRVNLEDLRQIAVELGGRHATFLLKCAQKSWRMWQGGNQWSGYVAYLSFFRHIAKLDLPKYEDYQHWESAAIHGGPRMMHDEFCMVSDRPVELHVTGEQNSPHCETGPYCRWSDDTALYALHSVRSPIWLVDTPAEKIDPKSILKETNAEVRREIVRKVGIDRICHSLKAKCVQAAVLVISETRKPRLELFKTPLEKNQAKIEAIREGAGVTKTIEYELLMLNLGDDRSRPYLKMHNPSVAEIWHVEGVGVECTTVEEALHFRKPEAMKQIPIDEKNGEAWVQQGDVCVWPEHAKSLQSLPSKLT